MSFLSNPNLFDWSLWDKKDKRSSSLKALGCPVFGRLFSSKCMLSELMVKPHSISRALTVQPNGFPLQITEVMCDTHCGPYTGYRIAFRIGIDFM